MIDHLNGHGAEPADGTPRPEGDGLYIGITGGIGSGKSAVADHFEELGVPVLRADTIARRLMVEDAELRAAIVELLGPEAYTPDGDLDRGWVAERIFADPGLRDGINALVHPRTIEEQNRRAEELFRAGHRIVASEAALIYESNGEDRFDYIIVVDAPREVRLQRAAARDGATREEVERRDSAQIPAEQKAEWADFVVRNDSTIEQLRSNATFVLMMLRTLPPRRVIELDLDESELDEDDNEENGSDAGEDEPTT